MDFLLTYVFALVVMLLPTLTILAVFGLIYCIFKIPGWICRQKFNKEFLKYLEKVNNSSINDREREELYKEFTAKHGDILIGSTFGYPKCGNPRCACNHTRVSHHVYWFG
jgi:hypothetical protein